MKSLIRCLSVFLFLVLIACSTKENNNVITEIPSEEGIDPDVRLKQGNLRFYEGKSLHPHTSLVRMKELSKGQHPFAIVISCSDSRAPDEIIFDRGLGDLFVIRTAGNVIADIGLGSIEYAVDHLNVKYILVMGHEQCGAVKAFAEQAHPNNHISTILGTLTEEPEIKKLQEDKGATNYVSKLVQANVVHQSRMISHSSPALEEKIRNGELKVGSAVYDIETGEVKFISDIDHPWRIIKVNDYKKGHLFILRWPFYESK